MLISNIINDGFGLLSKQLRFYCWHFRRNLDQRQRQELIELLYEQHFERLANKIKSLNHNAIADSQQQVGKLLFEHCLTRNRRHQLIQLVESRLVDINVRLDNYGRTLLHRSAYNLDVELVKILIEHGINIRLRDYAGNTALHIAIQSYRNGAVIYGNESDVVKNLTSIIRLLLEADKNLQNERYKRKRVKLVSDDSTSCCNEFKPSPDKRKPVDQVAMTVSDNESESNSLESVTNFSMQQMQSPNESHRRLSRSPSKITTTKPLGNNFNASKSNEKQDKRSTQSIVDSKDQDYSNQPDYSAQETINPLLLEDFSSPLVDTKNAFGRTALHYCVLVVGEQHLSHFVQLLISFGADTDATDTRMKTPLYCLVKRPGISAIRQKCLAISHLINSGCDDLGLAINPGVYFNEKFIKNLESRVSTLLQPKTEGSVEAIFTHSTFKRVPSLKHLLRLRLIKLQDERTRLKRQTKLSLPLSSPNSLNLYVNRKILDQSELF